MSATSPTCRPPRWRGASRFTTQAASISAASRVPYPQHAKRHQPRLPPPAPAGSAPAPSPSPLSPQSSAASRAKSEDSEHCPTASRAGVLSPPLNRPSLRPPRAPTGRRARSLPCRRLARPHLLEDARARSTAAARAAVRRARGLPCGRLINTARRRARASSFVCASKGCATPAPPAAPPGASARAR